MRKYLLVLTTILAVFAIFSCQPSKDTYRADFVKGCVTSYAKDSTVANTEGRKYVEQYCNCLGDKMNAEMDADAWKTFNRSGDTALNRFKNEIAPCKAEFKANVASIKKD